MKSRIFEICQDVVHPTTGVSLLTQSQIEEALAHKSIKRYAYVLHDKDTYMVEDQQKNPAHIAGQQKAPHWHVDIELGSNQLDTAVIAKWFNVPEQYVIVKKGAGAFLDCVEYLTHEHPKQQAKGKHRYNDDEVHANFNWREELDHRRANINQYGRNLSTDEQMLYDVLYNGKTLRQCIDDDRILYMKHVDKLKKFRMDYLTRQTPPSTRINYYVSGQGGAGKGLICRAIARSIFPQMQHDEDIFFEVGAKGAAFEGYDGQPVIIWNDRRSIDLLMELNGRGNVFNIFDSHPTKQKQNIKFGSISLPNAVNIVNSVESYTDFLDGLSGEYTNKNGEKMIAEDKSQSYRRFPMIIPLHEEDFDLLINKGFITNTRDFYDYIEYKGILCNMQKIAAACGDNTQLRRSIEAQAVRPIIDEHNKLICNSSTNYLPREIFNYGKTREEAINDWEQIEEEYQIENACLNAPEFDPEDYEEFEDNYYYEEDYYEDNQTITSSN